MPVLDTSFLIAVERREPDAQDLMNQFQEAGDLLCVPTAVWVEYLTGVTPRVRAQAANILARATEVVAFDETVADRAILLQDELMRTGRRLGWHDLQVAATALHRHDALATRDEGFADVEGLQVLGLQAQA